jgi:segregation and condensation protein B
MWSAISEGYALRTKTRFGPAIRAAHPGRAGDAVGELTKTETFALTAIAYLQPVTWGEVSRLAGREISCDIIAALKRQGLIDGAIRAPQPGAPFAYVTTGKFLEAFGFDTLRDLPDLERLKADSLLESGQGKDDLDDSLGLDDAKDDGEGFGSHAQLGEPETIWTSRGMTVGFLLRKSPKQISRTVPQSLPTSMVEGIRP